MVGVVDKEVIRPWRLWGCFSLFALGGSVLSGRVDLKGELSGMEQLSPGMGQNVACNADEWRNHSFLLSNYNQS